MPEQQLVANTKVSQCGGGAQRFEQPAEEEGVLEADEEAAEGQVKGPAERQTGGMQQSAFPEKRPGDNIHFVLCAICSC